VGTYLRVGFSGHHGWRTLKVRQDFAAAAKIQTEDDISASIVVPRQSLSYLADDMGLGIAPLPSSPPPDVNPSFESSRKFVSNCEHRLFQRPDDAIHRGFDKQAEADLARQGVNFISNFEPLTRADVEDMMTKVVDFDAFTAPMKKLLVSVQESDHGYI